MSATSTDPTPETPEVGSFRGPIGIEARRRKVRAALLSVAGVLVVAGAAGAISRSAIFAVQHITVTGNRQLSDGRIEQLAGLSGHPNLLWLSTASVQHRLLEDPWLAAATVSRSLPSAVTITVRERTPVAIAWSGSRAFLLAADGTVLDPARGSVRLPVVSLPANLTLESGSRVSSAAVTLRVAAGFPAGLAQRIATVKLGPSGVEVLTRDGVRVIYGDATDIAAKGVALDAVLVWIEQHNVKPVYIDVSAPSAPAVLPVGALVTGSTSSSSNAGGVQIVPVPGAPQGGGAGSEPHAETIDVSHTVGPTVS